MKIQEIKEIYKKFSLTYESDVKGEMRYTAYVKVPQFILKHLNSETARILDLGCGTGLSSSLFFKAGYQVTGVDGSSAMIKHARKLPFQKLVCQDLGKPLRVKDESFDAAVMVGVMEYISNPAAVLKQVRRKLKPGGIFGLTFSKKSNWCEQSGLKSYYKKDLEPMIREAGFSIIESDKILGVEEYGHKTYYWIYILKKA